MHHGCSQSGASSTGGNNAISSNSTSVTQAAFIGRAWVAARASRKRSKTQSLTLRESTTVFLLTQFFLVSMLVIFGFIQSYLDSNQVKSETSTQHVQLS